MEPIDHLLSELSHEVGRADRPFVTLSYAQSLDGSLARERGSPLALSGEASLRFTHRLRAVHDAILVGIGTVLSDNPLLTVRGVAGENPHAVILDPRLRLPPDAHLIRASGRRVTVLCGATVGRPEIDPLEALGVQVVRLEVDERGWIPIVPALLVLGEIGVRRLMVEGGARVISSFLSTGHVDEVVLTIAPVFVGGQHALETPVSNGSNGLPRLSRGGSQELGGDIVVWGKFSL